MCVAHNARVVCFADSIKSRIETVHDIRTCNVFPMVCFADSIKSRIETNNVSTINEGRKMFVLLIPLNQGLKQCITHNTYNFTPLFVLLIPLNQGLKQTCIHFDDVIESVCFADSIKSRIETKPLLINPQSRQIVCFADSIKSRIETNIT